MSSVILSNMPLKAMLMAVLFVACGGADRAAIAQSHSPTASSEAKNDYQFIEWSKLGDPAYATVESINVRQADLRDVIRGIAREYDLNVFVDNGIERKVTLRLSEMRVARLLQYLARQYDLQLEQSGSILRIMKAPLPPLPELNISFSDGRLSVDLKDAALSRVVRKLTDMTGRNVVAARGVDGAITAYLQEVPVMNGVRTLADQNGFSVRKRDSLIVITRGGLDASEVAAGQTTWVDIENGKIQFDLNNALIGEVLREIADRKEVDLISYGLPENRITASASDLTLNEAFAFLLQGTKMTYRREGEILFLGPKNQSGMKSSRLIRLHHVRVKGLLEKIPSDLKQNATLQVVKEHNGILAYGNRDVIGALERFLEALDEPQPQILIEALVVDYKSTDYRELGVRFGVGEGVEDRRPERSYQFGGEDGHEDGIDINLNGQDVIEDLGWWGKKLGFRTISQLPPNFYLQIRALEQEGKVDILSRPQIVTLNGNAASISIGTTQYYILENTTVPGGGYSPIQQERFEKIEANVKLEVVPWVSATGEVITEIRPEFSTPVGRLQPGVPPTINSRVLDATVRLKDGETIVLGGLIQESITVNHNKVPILGDIPLLGLLFRNTVRSKRESELVIYLTPHVFYGGPAEERRWMEYRDESDLPYPGNAID